MKKILIVTIGEQNFGLDVEGVSSILPRQDGTLIPQAHRGIAGLINVRGHIVTLVDVCACLGMADTGKARMNVTIERRGEIYGLLFDAVGDILELDGDVMEPLPAVLMQRWNGMASGIFRLPDALVILLDTDCLVASIQPVDEPDT